MSHPRLRIGTRGSKLALAQAGEASRRLCATHGFERNEIEIVAITTTGDKVGDRPLAEIGGKGLFTKEIEEALLAGAIDIAVHSMKDMPTQLPNGLSVASLLPREDPRDAFLSAIAASIDGLPEGACVGSSSVRRSAQIRRLRPDVKIVPYRGNVDTRLRKLEAGDVDATFLACAGLIRLGLADRITAAVPMEQMLPAVAQGAVGLEIRNNDEATRQLVAMINDADTATQIACERSFLAVLDGSCRTPLAGYAKLDGDQISFRCEALTPDGAHVYSAASNGFAKDAERIGREAGEEVKGKGGALLTL